MQKGDVLAGDLSQRTNIRQAVHPAVGPFHHPASGFEAGRFLMAWASSPRLRIAP